MELVPRGTTASPVVTEVAHPTGSDAASKLEALGLATFIRPAAPGEAGLVLDGRRILVKDLT